MATWPAIPAWLMGVSINVEPVLRSSTPGYASQRRAFDRRNDIMDATLSLTAAEFATFETFVQTTLNQGSDQFTGPYYDGAGYRTGTVQLVGGNYAPVWNGSHFDVSAQLQVFDRRDPDSNDLFELLFDISISTFSDSVVDLLAGYYPE